ncbi:spore germination protein [Fictibacillus phosphorivorans]|uniref:spore germination protein n=1 Tax=Fictibacillus phosphorivorans TaxID=1221500 RepID=UPI00203F98C1|nr:spore germination protein [Fictibacillus phosphorivorans]MCM3719697.1 spore germination protein [Fictibacillus phosphorivorans]MCM3777388.1 spore germination protein [Fictibacillus phosphorivorans]
MADTKNKAPISKNIEVNEKFLKDRLGIGVSFDVGVRKIFVLKKELQLYYCTGLCDSEFIIMLYRELMDMDHGHRSPGKVKDLVHNHLAHQQVELTKSLDEAVDRMLSGLIAIFVDGEEEAFIVDVRSYPGRSPEEPDIEKVVRGSRDGYTENIIINTALTRRRIRDERLRHEILQVGERSKTDICLSYIQDVADPGLVDLIRNELGKIQIDGIPMADKTIEEFIVRQGWNPFPLVRYTERPDVAAQHLMEGHVLIITDTSPSVIITPTTLFHHVQHAEEYRQTPFVGAFLRWIRFMGILASIFIVPMWLLFSLNKELLPPFIDFIGPNKTTNIPLFLQIILAEIGIDILRLAAIHTPSALSTAMGLIAAVLIGQIAIDVGLFVPEVILYVAIAAIGSYSTPSYELSVANKVLRLLLIFLVVLFNVPGFMIGVTLIIIYMSNIKNLNTPYLWPFLPFNPKAFFQIVVRISVPSSKVRPSIVHPQNPRKQPTN